MCTQMKIKEKRQRIETHVYTDEDQREETEDRDTCTQMKIKEKRQRIETHVYTDEDQREETEDRALIPAITFLAMKTIL